MHLTRYFLVSLVALAIDAAIFSLLISFSCRPGMASVSSYMLGAAAHFMLSKTVVFKSSGWRATEPLLFGATCLLGATITWIIVACISAITSAYIAKALAVVFSFFIIYLLRKYVVFRKRDVHLGKPLISAG